MTRACIVAQRIQIFPYALRRDTFSAELRLHLLIFTFTTMVYCNISGAIHHPLVQRGLCSYDAMSGEASLLPYWMVTLGCSTCRQNMLQDMIRTGLDYPSAHQLTLLHPLLIISCDHLVTSPVSAGTYYAAIMGNFIDFQDKVVMDVGAGSGILSLFAAQVSSGSP